MTTFLAKLDYRGSILLSGVDGRSFLQGQTTCNLDELSAEHSLVGAYCNPQGRMVCDFRLWQLPEDRILMGLEADTLASAMETFGKYIVFSKATMEDATPEYVHYGLWGATAAELAEAGAGDAHASWQRDGIIWTRTEMDNVFEACVHASAVEQFESAMAGCERVGADAYRELEIAAGIGHVKEATSGLFLPQMLNYQHTGRISFTKGCYTGQEVVARLHYKGKVKRPMLPAHASTGEAAEPGTELFKSGKSVGHVVVSSASDAGVFLLANVVGDAVEEDVSLGPEGPVLVFDELPYPLDSD